MIAVCTILLALCQEAITLSWCLASRHNQRPKQYYGAGYLQGLAGIKRGCHRSNPPRMTGYSVAPAVTTYKSWAPAIDLSRRSRNQ